MVLDTGDVVTGPLPKHPGGPAGRRIDLHERWERFGAAAATGMSYLEEITRRSTGERR